MLDFAGANEAFDGLARNEVKIDILVYIEMRFAGRSRVRQEIGEALILNKCGIWNHLSDLLEFALLGPFVARLFEQFAERGIGGVLIVINDAAGDFKLHALRPLPELLDEHDITGLGQGYDVHPIGRMDDKEVAVATRAFFLAAVLLQFEIWIFGDNFFRRRRPLWNRDIVFIYHRYVAYPSASNA